MGSLIGKRETRGPFAQFLVSLATETYYRLAFLSQHKVVRGRFFNVLGMQVFRVCAARFLLTLRRALYFRELQNRFPECDVLAKEGLVIIPNFLGPAQYAEIRSGFQKSFEDMRSRNVYQGRYDTEVNKIDFEDGNTPDFAAPLFDDPRLAALLEYGEGRKVDRKRPRWSGRVECWFEQIVAAGDDAENLDPQLLLHRDTFHSTHKMIYYVNDVQPEDGPFTYILGSNQLNFKRLVLEYINSIQKTPDLNLRATDNSEKINETSVVAKGNTLVVADVFGFHRRGNALNRSIRKTIRMSVRSNPFF